MIRLFAAIALPEDIGDGLLRRQHGLPGAKWRPRSAFHITLRFVGEVAENVAEDLDAELAAISVEPLTRAEYRAATASNQPQRRGRPVTVPYSQPTRRMRSPISLSSSVGKGPPPTRVVYAFTIPIQRSMCRVGTPDPEAIPAALLFELVTYG